MKAGLVALGLAVSLSVPAWSQDSPSGLAQFAQRREYFLAGNGYWFAQNPGYQADVPSSPSHFGYHFSPGPNPASLAIQIVGLAGRDTLVYWSGVYFWHPGRNRVEYRSLSAWGAVASGYSLGPNELRFEVVGPDGSATVHLDRETILGPNRFESVSFLDRNGRWHFNQALTWSRETA